MKNRILSDPELTMGAIVWIAAATLLPLQLGMANATPLALAVYLLIAGTLLAVADAVLNPASYYRFGDVGLQSVFWTISLAVPGVLLFALGTFLTPASHSFTDDLCRMAGLAHFEGALEGALEEAFEPSEECETAR